MSIEQNLKVSNIPTKSLEKQVVIGGKNLIDASAKFVNLQQSRNKVREKKDRLLRCSVEEKASVAWAKYKDMKKKIQQIRMEKKRDKLVEQALDVLYGKECNLCKFSQQVKEKMDNNMVNRQKALKDICELLTQIYEWSQAVKDYEAKQLMLLQLQGIMERMYDELSKYENTLGHLNFKDGSTYYSIADTMVLKEEALSDRAKSINGAVLAARDATEMDKKELFRRSIELSEGLQAKCNKIMVLQEVDVKKLNEVLELESKVTELTVRSHGVKEANAKFYLFVEWALRDMLGIGDLAEVARTTSLYEKVQTIIDYVRSLNIKRASLRRRKIEEKSS